MDTKSGAATGTNPFGPLASDETSDSEKAYRLEVFNHAHPVFCPVTPVQVRQPLTGKVRAITAVPRAASFPALTVLHPTPDAGLGFGAVITPATGAGIPEFPVRLAQPAVHPAGSDERGRFQARGLCSGRVAFMLRGHSRGHAASAVKRLFTSPPAPRSGTWAQGVNPSKQWAG
jgi:hypothetical protein